MRYLITVLALLAWLVWLAKATSAQIGVPPPWIPQACFRHGPCEPATGFQRWSTQLKVEMLDGKSVVFDYSYVPGKSRDDTTWACMDGRLRMMPLLPVWRGSCLFLAVRR